MTTKLVFVAYQLSEPDVVAPVRLQRVTFTSPAVRSLVTYRAEGREPGNPEGRESLAAAVCEYLVATFPELVNSAAASHVLFCGMKVHRFVSQLAYECSLPVSAARSLPMGLLFPSMSHIEIESLWSDLSFEPPEIRVPLPGTGETDADTVLRCTLNHVYELAVRYGLMDSSGCLSKV